MTIVRQTMLGTTATWRYLGPTGTGHVELEAVDVPGMKAGSLVRVTAEAYDRMVDEMTSEQLRSLAPLDAAIIVATNLTAERPWEIEQRRLDLLGYLRQAREAVASEGTES